jgi:hypothetical protein
MRTPKVKVLSDAEAAAALDAADATAVRWSNEAADLTHAAEVLAGELAEAQARAADDLLDLEDLEADQAAVARVAGELQRRQMEQGIAVQAAERAAERLTEARRDVLKARAGSLRTRASQLRDAATTHQARTDQLLAALSEWERVPFEPIPFRTDLGTSRARLTLTQQATGRAQWLEDLAGTLDHVAGSGAADQVLSQLNAELPEQIEVEAAVLVVPNTSAAV